MAMKPCQRSSPRATSLIVLLSCASVPSIALSFPITTAQIVRGAAGYQQAMQSGYAAAAKQDYGKALAHFKHALKLQPGDRNAQIVIDNLSRYQKTGKGFHVTPSGIGAPSVRERAATRQQNCLDGQKLVAIIPSDQLGLTSLAQPTLLFYIPPTSAQTLQVRLEDSAGAVLYEKTLKTPKKSGFAGFNFAEFKDSPSLKPETTYQWTFTLQCNPQDTSADVTVSGMIRRINLNPILESQLKNMSNRDRATLYANNGLWYDAVKALDQARQSNPTDTRLAEDWSALLKSINL
jgi:tetratricopeptide (TPR) repeat protein